MLWLEMDGLLYALCIGPIELNVVVRKMVQHLGLIPPKLHQNCHRSKLSEPRPLYER